MMKPTARILVLFAVLVAAVPLGGHAVSGSRVPSCRSSATTVPSVNLDTGFFSLHGIAVNGYLSAGYGKVWTPGSVTHEFDVVNAQIGFDMPGVVGGGRGTIGSAASGTAVQEFVGALRGEVASFTGHFKAVARVHYCRSVLDPRKIVRTDVSEIWLSGFGSGLHGGNPNPAGLAAPSGVVSQLVLKPGSTRSW